MFKQLMASFLAVCEMLFPSAAGTQQPLDATNLILSDTAIYADGELVTEDSSAVWMSDSMVVIEEPGTYLVTGGLSDGTLAVDLTDWARAQGYSEAKECPEAVVTLILDSVSIRSSNGPGLMVSGAYECDTTLGQVDDKPSAVQDTSGAGVNLVLPDGSASVISGSYNTDRKQAALISNVTMNVFGQSDKATLSVQSGENGITSLGHLVFNGGTVQVMSTEDGVTANTENAAIMIGDTDLSIYTQEGNGIYSGGYVLTTSGQVFVTAGGKGYGIEAKNGLVTAGGIVASAGNANTLPDTGDQPSILLNAEHPLLDVAVMDGSGRPVYVFNLGMDENYAGMDINRTFESLLLSTPYLNVGSSYTVWTGAVLDRQGEWSHGILREPGKYNVTDGYPLKYSRVSIGSGKTFAASYLASVYDMATILDRANGLDADADMAALDTQAEVLAQLDAAADLQQAAVNAQEAMSTVDRSTMMGKDLWAQMNEAARMEQETSSSRFVMWDASTGFDGVFGLQRSFSALDLPAQLDAPAQLDLAAGPLDAPAQAVKPFYAGMFDLPAHALDAPAQVPAAGYDFNAVMMNEQAAMEADGQTFFFDGSRSSFYTNLSGLPVSGDTISTHLPGHNAVRLWNEGKGHLQKVSVSKSGDGTSDTMAENAAVFSGSGSYLFFADSDLLTKALYAPAAWAEEDSDLNLMHVSTWTNQPFSPALVSAPGGFIDGNFLALTTYGGGSPVLRSLGGELKVHSADLSSTGVGSPLIQADGKVTVELANGKALQSPIAELSKTLTIADSDLYAFDQSNNIPAGFILRSENDEVVQLAVTDSSLQSENETAVMFYVDRAKAQLRLTNTGLSIKSGWLLRVIEGDVAVFADNQELAGTIFSDSSIVRLYLTNNSTWEGMPVGDVEVSLDSGSTWCVTGDTSIKSLELQDGARIIDPDGKACTLMDASGNILKRGSGKYTVVCQASNID